MAEERDILSWLKELPDKAPFTWDGVQSTVLIGIFYELKKLNSLLHCPNFTAIPGLLREIEKNTRKRTPKKAKP